MDFLNNGMQLVVWYKYDLCVYTMLHFLSKLLRQLCVPSHTHREWVWSYCTGEHNKHGSVA